jgi:hypothetical protein
MDERDAEDVLKAPLVVLSLLRDVQRVRAVRQLRHPTDTAPAAVLGPRADRRVIRCVTVFNQRHVSSSSRGSASQRGVINVNASSHVMFDASNVTVGAPGGCRG